MSESETRFTVEPQLGRWDPEVGRIVTELEDAAYKRGWNAAVDQIVSMLGAIQAAIETGADPMRLLPATSSKP